MYKEFIKFNKAATVIFLVAILLVVYKAVGILGNNARNKFFTIETAGVTVVKTDENGKYYFQRDMSMPGEGWITGISIETEGIPDGVFHHMFLTYQGRKDAVCPQYDDRFFGVGQELTPLALPKDYGYPVEADGHFALTSHFINLSGRSFDNVKFRIRISFEPRTSLDIKSVYPIFLVAKSCDEYMFPVVPGEQEFSLDPEFTVPQNMMLVAAASHFHDFGRELEVNVDGKPLVTFRPELVGSRIAKIPSVIFDDNERPKLLKGQKLGLTVKYNNTSSEIMDGMGTSFLYVQKD